MIAWYWMIPAAMVGAAIGCLSSALCFAARQADAAEMENEKYLMTERKETEDA